MMPEPLLFAEPRITEERRPEGTTLLRSLDELGPSGGVLNDAVIAAP
jgi:hypothetical protein